MKRQTSLRLRALFGAIVLMLGEQQITNYHLSAQDSMGPITVGKLVAILDDKAINESSGLVLSHHNPNCFWTHNDSGDSARLFLVNSDGKSLARVQIAKADAIDWEDIAIHVAKDDAYLIIGDIGGNAKPRKHITLYIVREPKLSAEAQKRGETMEFSVDIDIVMEVTFPGGVTNYESIAVDHSNHSILIVEKGNFAGRVYTVPLPPNLNNKQVIRVEAKQIGVAPVPMATACDMSADGRSLVIISYNIGFLFHREPNRAGKLEPWKSVLEREPVSFSLGKLRQTEAVCFSKDERSLIVTSEKVPTPLVEIELPINLRR